jgi:hypothetical protein
LILSIFGGYWAFLEPKLLEEVGDEKPTSKLYKPGLFEAMGEQSEQIYDEEKTSQSHFYAEKLLSRRHCRTISRRSRCPFCMLFSLQGSRDLGEHDQISLVAIWNCSDVILSF